MRKWPVLAAFWLLQGLIAFVLATAWIVLNDNSGGTTRPLFGFSVGDFLELTVDLEWQQAWVVIGLFTLLQGLFLLPVARPSARRDGRATPMWLSAGAAGVAVALLWGAAVMGVIGLLQALDATDWGPWLRDYWFWALLASLALSWLVATPLLYAFSRNRPREDALSRIASAVFMGTIVEAIAIVPIDVMMRRKTDCWCDTGTFWALSACGTVGLFMLGPAIFLPLLARRRRRWYAGRCDACGYDMHGLAAAARCPECGAGWREPR